MRDITDCAVLYLCVNDDEHDLRDHYKNVLNNHNDKSKNAPYPDAGFDLFFPEEKIISLIESIFISMKIKCEMCIFNKKTNNWEPTSYYLYPRSSISKTPLMLANQTGIIDSGYRGDIIGAFRNISGGPLPFKVEKFTRLLQICAHDLRPIIVELVNKDFFEKTDRNVGGFGSTGV